jgi:2-amino-4-hydroxy-6-hydroxymethyldihydropteridine diphosphokinase
MMKKDTIGELEDVKITLQSAATELPHTVFIALGGNLGDRRANLQAGLARLRAGGRLQVQRISRLYETEPWGYADQSRFLNMALVAKTDLEPLALLDYLKEVEAALGRQPDFPNAPRPLDLDIIFYDNIQYTDERLQIPHPRLRGRAFVLAPLTDIAAEYLHPALNLSVAQLLTEVDLSEAGVRVYEAEPPLELPSPRFIFVTGRLAQQWLEEYLAQTAPKLGFEYKVAALNIDVAAFITCRFIADKLLLTADERQSFDLLVVPGFAGGDLAAVEQATGLRTLRGPTELHELESFCAGLVSRHQEVVSRPFYYTGEQLRRMHEQLRDPNIRIYIDGQHVYAFNDTVFGQAEPNERGLRSLFRLLKIENAAHAYYIGREFYKASVCIRLQRPYHQDCEPEL